MSYETPKTDWAPTNNIGFSDLNRIEGNIEYLASKVVATDSFAFTFPGMTAAETIYFEKYSDGTVKMWWSNISGMTAGPNHTAAERVPVAFTPSVKRYVPAFIQSAQAWFEIQEATDDHPGELMIVVTSAGNTEIKSGVGFYKM